MFDPKTVDSLMLAYVGDSAWEILVRERLFYTVPQGNTEANRVALEYVTAAAQVKALERISHLFTEEEQDVFRRGKNTKTHNTPKSVSRYEYRQATGLEAVFGYNYLLGRHERNKELFNAAFPQEQM